MPLGPRAQSRGACRDGSRRFPQQSPTSPATLPAGHLLLLVATVCPVTTANPTRQQAGTQRTHGRELPQYTAVTTQPQVLSSQIPVLTCSAHREHAWQWLRTHSHLSQAHQTEPTRVDPHPCWPGQCKDLLLSLGVMTCVPPTLYCRLPQAMLSVGLGGREAPQTAASNSRASVTQR